MKFLSQIHAFLLLSLMVFWPNSVTAQSAPPGIYEARGKICDSCIGSGKLTCVVCKGEDLTKQMCPSCKGQDLTKQPCLTCKGQDLTKQLCLTCKGQDLTKQPCLACKGQDLTKQPCLTCKGRGTIGTVRCYLCSGRGTRPVCYSCGGKGNRSVCYSCRGVGTRSVCYSCGGKAASGAFCNTCNGRGAFEVLIAKYRTSDDLRKQITSQIDKPPLAPAIAVASDPFTAQDGSVFGEISKDTGNPKTVFVSAYTKKDGTIVKSHFRSLPNSQVVSKDPVLRTTPAVAENGSYYGEPNKSGVPKTISVSGYYRKDGTYVRGHYRSAPRR